MIYVNINRQQWEYDIHSLVKAFYPQEQVKVVTPADKSPVAKAAGCANREKNIAENINQDAGAQFIMDIVLSEDGHMCITMPSGRQYEKVLEAADEKGRKDCFKQFLYLSLSDDLGRKLPWGNLTGIRPTKIAMTMMESGESDDVIAGVFQKQHFVSEEKTRLAIEIAKREKKLLQTLHYQDGYSLYIGIPFCPTTCLYCSFTSYPISRFQKQVETYIDCVIREMQETARMMQGKILDTVYIGGGTPTTLEAGQLGRLITNLKQIFDFSTVQEFTVEAGRADSITGEKLEVLRGHGVSRISVNPQTMHDETLKLIGRRHTVQQVKDAFWRRERQDLTISIWTSF